MHTKVRFILTLACLLTTSCGSSSNTPLPTMTATETPTLIPTITKTATPTNTPKPTETFTPKPTVTPGPYWQTPFGEFPHAVNDNGQETYNFLLPFEQYLRLPDITPTTINAYHNALKTIKLSDGSPLVKPMNTEEFNKLPGINWVIQDWPYKDIVWYGNENIGDRNNPPMRYVGGFIFYYPGSNESKYTRIQGDFIGITMQVMDRTQTEGYVLWTAIFPKGTLSGMSSQRVPAIFNNNSQLAPFLDFQPGDKNTTWWDMFMLLKSAGLYDAEGNDQALRDFVSGKRTVWFNSHVILAAPGATRWISP